MSANPAVRVSTSTARARRSLTSRPRRSAAARSSSRFKQSRTSRFVGMGLQSWSGGAGRVQQFTGQDGEIIPEVGLRRTASLAARVLVLSLAGETPAVPGEKKGARTRPREDGMQGFYSSGCPAHCAGFGSYQPPAWPQTRSVGMYCRRALEAEGGVDLHFHPGTPEASSAPPLHDRFRTRGADRERSGSLVPKGPSGTLWGHGASVVK